VVARDVRLRVERRLRAAGVTASSETVKQLSDYFGLLAKWNTRLNLTGLTLEPPSNDAIDRLLIEPTIAAQSILETDARLVDLGSGGGSPALPLKIAASKIKLVMVESKVRKAAFLRDAVRQLGLTPVEVANVRFEELLARSDLNEAADIVSVRAVRADRKLWGPVHAFLKPNGRVFWFASAGSGAPGPESGLAVESLKPLLGSSQLNILRKVS
jgi:16S rRNA (guanine527-N7)-methyltransferase